MNTWRALANEALGKSDPWNTRDDRDTSPPNAPSVPSAPLLDPVRSLRVWEAGLNSVSWDQPLHGLDRLRWREAVGDAHWLAENFAQQAARDGWSAHDMFGVMPGRDGWGGIACRLRGSRSLVMSSDVARWRRVVNGGPESFARGLGDTVQMVPLWEALRG